jgi:HK97 gp10 family phage protein
MTQIILTPAIRNSESITAWLKQFGKDIPERARRVVRDSMNRAYDAAQADYPEDSGETKSKMRKELAEDGFSYRVGFAVNDFPPGDFVPGFLEDGTRFMPAQPRIRPVAKLERVRFRRDLNQVLRTP